MKLQNILTLLVIVISSPYNEGRAQENPDRFPQAGAREENHRIKLTARVINEENESMSNVPIKIRIENINDFQDGYNDFRGKTDNEGKFAAEGTSRGAALVTVEMDGYYPSEKRVTFNDGTIDEIREANKFFPWNPTIDIMVKKIGRPIPMISRLYTGGARSLMTLKYSEEGEKIGWDLIEGDWVTPNGKGKIADLLVSYQSSFTDELHREVKIQLELGNPHDGFKKIKELVGKESLLKFPREAPSNGYDTSQLEYIRKLEGTDLILKPNPKPEGYLFRIRTKINNKSQVTSALYGKITKDFEIQDNSFQGERGIFLHFDYYLNPIPNDRNLEFDPAKNLAPEVDKELRWNP